MTIFSFPKAIKTRFAEAYIPRRISAILADSRPPDTTAAERDFDELQSQFPAVPEYGYDEISLARRAAWRMAASFDHLPRADQAITFLDVGAGDGTLGAMMAALAHDVALCDLEDWRKPPAMGLPFFVADCCKQLPFESNHFDLVTSFNAFEHMEDPEAALAEIIRVTKPGGIIHLDFGPLYAAPWGLHAYRSLAMPYPQFLFSDTFITNKLHEIGITDLGQQRTELQFLNGWLINQYRLLWEQPSIEVLTKQMHSDQSYWRVIARYPGSFRGRGLKFDDVVTTQIKIVLRKRVENRFEHAGT